jgi:isocitrate/isopropylmalate dehydrogenase
VHGSAPRHAGAGRANPSGAYLALAALLEWFAETAELGAQVRGALERALATGPLTYDLAPPGSPVASTRELAARINAELEVLVP